MTREELDLFRTRVIPFRLCAHHTPLTLSRTGSDVALRTCGGGGTPLSSCPHYTPIGRTRTGEGDVSPGGWDPGGGEVFPPPPHYTPRRLTHTRVPVVRDGRGPIH